MDTLVRITAIVSYGAMILLTITSIVLGIATGMGLVSSPWYFPVGTGIGAGVSHLLWRELVWEKTIFGWWRR